MSTSRSLRSAQRIISLPITRNGRHPTSNPASGNNKILTYYHFQLHLPHRKAKRNEEDGNMSRWNPRFWTQWAQTKAADTWAGFGKAPEGSWKLRVFRGGEAMVDRIDFEELALKGVDPSLGPTILHPDISRKGEKERERQDSKILLFYPPSIHSGDESLSYLRSLVQSRSPSHRKGFWIWMFAAPFTAPFMLIPIIPNLPFFFCVWRSWSHYRAYRASEYLAALIRNGHIVPEPSQLLDTIYKDFAPKSLSEPSSAEPETTSSSPNPSRSSSEMEPLLKEDTPRLLLTRDAVPAIVSAFDLKQSASADIYRALEQAKNRLSRSGS
ncbi:hypothetical protein VKT23_003525 [Stygiomarasmius scandens]|uniref:Mitochondrial K+-H+ exchange-related-domain-containing protein n=1 Tax=Marasmiellus scandens TaxID=2682957 RepID=A0ABR1K0A5_9AGAR